MATYYWVGGTGNWSDATNHWANVTNGTPNAAYLPTATDNVVFDANSNVGTGAFTVTVDGTSASPSLCQDFSTGGGGGALDGAMTLSLGATAELDCYGSMTLPATNFTWTGTTGAQLTFLSTATGKTITTNGVNVTATKVDLSGIGGAWTLGSAFTNTISAFQINAGTFSTSNFNLSIGSGFVIAGAQSKTINLGSSTITAPGGTPLNYSGSNVTLNAGTSTITCSSASPTFAGSGLTFYNVSFTSAAAGTVTISGINIFNNLTFTSRSATGVRNIVFGADQTVNGALTFGTANTAIRRIQVDSDIPGTQRTITWNGTIATLADVNFANIKTIGGTWSGTRIGSGGNLTGITADAPANKYWNLAAGGNWSATAWATSSGGAVNVNNFPLPQDLVVIENTGLNTSATITMDLGWWLPAINLSTRSNAMTFDLVAQAPRNYGNLTLSSSVTVAATTGSFNFYPYNTTHVISGTAASFAGGISINASGTTQKVNIANNFTTTGTVTLTYGTLDLTNAGAGNYTLTCNTFNSNNSNTRAITFGTGNITVTGNNATIWNTTTQTGFSYTGTPTVNSTYSGSVGTRTIRTATIANGASETNAISLNVSAGSDILSIAFTFKNIDFTGFSGTLANNPTKNIFGYLTISSGMTLEAGTLKILFLGTSGPYQITTNGKTLDFPISFSGLGGTWNFQDALTMGATNGTFTALAGTINFKAGTTNTVKTATLTGAVGQPVVIGSTTAGTQATIKALDLTKVDGSYLTIKDSYAFPMNIWYAGNSTNNGNNTNWFFGPVAYGQGNFLLMFS